MPLLDGPRLPPASGRPPKQLVVFLHGYGADGNDLISLGRSFARLLPDAAFVSPHAPERLAMGGMGGGYQWFPLTMRDPSEYGRGVARALPALNAFLDAELTRYRLADASLALVGFSQGTMMALHAGFSRPRAVAGIVGFSGLLAAPEALATAPSKPPVVLIHGDADQVLPVDFLYVAANALGAAEVPVEWHVRPGLPHGIDEEGLAIAGAFLKRVLRA